MSRHEFKRIPAVVMSPNHPRIVAAVRAGRLVADEYNDIDSWDIEPPQIPVELLAGATPGEMLTIMRAWSDGYRVRCAEIEATSGKR